MHNTNQRAPGAWGRTRSAFSKRATENGRFARVPPGVGLGAGERNVVAVRTGRNRG